jgi:hypothetical protein
MNSQNEEYSGIGDKEYIASASVEAFKRQMNLGIKSVETPPVFKFIKFNIQPHSAEGSITTMLMNEDEIIAYRTIHINDKDFHIEWKKMLEIIHQELVLIPGSSHHKLEYAKEHMVS